MSVEHLVADASPTMAEATLLKIDAEDQARAFHAQLGKLASQFYRYWRYAFTQHAAQVKAGDRGPLPGHDEVFATNDDYQEFSACVRQAREIATGQSYSSRYTITRTIRWKDRPQEICIYRSEPDGNSENVVYAGPIICMPKAINLADFSPQHLRILAEDMRFDVERTAAAMGQLDELPKLRTLVDDVEEQLLDVQQDVDALTSVLEASGLVANEPAARAMRTIIRNINEKLTAAHESLWEAETEPTNSNADVASLEAA